MWFRWRPVFGWPNLCPILFADPFGLVVVMPRAEQPVSSAEAHMAAGDFYPDITAETKPQDYGRVGNAVLALDYGLPWADTVRDRRTYYRRMETSA
jgi:hypothetical protein